jgi:predicted transcriptional regulator
VFSSSCPAVEKDFASHMKRFPKTIAKGVKKCAQIFYLSSFWNPFKWLLDTLS